MTDEQIMKLLREHLQYTYFNEPMAGLRFARALLAASAPNPSDKQEADGVAVTASGAEYHNPRKAYAEAEEAGCVRMWLDDLGAPIGDDAGTFSLVGRIRAHFANPSDKQEAIYQQGYPDGLWRDVTKSHYEMLEQYCRIVYKHPLAQSAEQDRIDAERYRKWVSYSGVTKEHYDTPLFNQSTPDDASR